MVKQSNTRFMFRYILSASLFSSYTFLTGVLIAEERPWEQQLSPSGKVALVQHDQLWNELIKKYDADVQKQANTQIDNLIRLNVSKTETIVREQTEIAIPEDLQAQAPKFASIELSGAGFEGFEKIFFKFADGTLVQANIYSASDTTLKIGTRELRNRKDLKWSLVIEGEGKVSKIDYFAHGGVSKAFPYMFYLPGGSEKPVKNVTVKVDPTTQRFIDGVSTFDSKKYFRLYLEPDWDRSGFEKLLREQGFFAGRQQTELRDALELAYGMEGFELMKEDPNKKGWHDRSFFERNDFSKYKDVPKDLEFCMCFNIWPTFMNVEVPKVKNERGTPKDLEAAATLAADLVKAQKRDSGRTATWWEVKNESDIQTEWSYHWVEGYNGWEKLAEFHNLVAAKVREVAPEVKVGGPASAWFHPEKSDKKPFQHWESQKTFMDQTKGKLDFYSHHFYERTWHDTHAALTTG